MGFGTRSSSAVKKAKKCPFFKSRKEGKWTKLVCTCLLYTSDAADELLCVDLGGRRIIQKKIT